MISVEHKEDRILQKLYRIAKENVEKPVTKVLIDVCNQTNLQFQKIMNVVEAMPNSLLKKRAISYADDGILYTETCKRKYFKKSSPCVSPMPAPLELPEAILQQINATENNIPKNDMDYAFQYKNSVEVMDWKECKRDGYFKNYSTPASLKRAFYKKRPDEERD